MSETLELRTFTRPSRSGGVTHVIQLAGESLVPMDFEHPCSCAAGAEGRPCWALLDVLADDTPKLSDRPDVLERAQLAAEERERRAAKSVRKGRTS